MPINLDNIDEIRSLDSKQMAESISKLSDQIKQVSGEVVRSKLPASYKKFKNIVFFGMGGSALGAHCIKSVFEKDLKVPFEIVNNYEAVGSVNKDSLVFVVSYSGSTEEAVSALKSAKAKKAKIVIVTSGGDLSKFAVKFKIPALIFGTENNPCGSPRMGLGYTIFGPLFILNKLGTIKGAEVKLNKIINTVEKYNELFGLKNPEVTNLAKQIAGAMVRGSIWYVASEHLSGSAHTAANQLNENAKRFGGYFLIPELNHHLLEGLTYPENFDSTFIFLESSEYDSRTQKRYRITKEVLTKKGKQFLTYSCNEKNRLLEMTEVLVLGSYLGFYSAMLEGVDPTAIPTVDFLKAALKDK